MTAFSLGPCIEPNGTTFRLWAPAAKTVELIGDVNCRPESADNGWHFATVQAARAGTRYKFRIGDDIEVPDPPTKRRFGQPYWIGTSA